MSFCATKCLVHFVQNKTKFQFSYKTLSNFEIIIKQGKYFHFILFGGEDKQK